MLTEERLLMEVPPNSIEAEQAVLGSMILSEQAILAVLEILDAQDFYRPVHQELFDSICAIRARKEPVDHISITEELRKRGKLEDCGGTEYLFRLTDIIFSIPNAEHYANIVAKKSARRKIITACIEVSGYAYNEDVEDPQERFLQVALQCCRTKTPGWSGTRDAASEAFNRINDLLEGIVPEDQIPYGIRPLDKRIDGVGPGAELTIIAGRPSAGKSSLVIEPLLNCLEMGFRVGVVSLETDRARLMQRIIARKAHIDTRKLRHGGYDADEKKELRKRLSATTNEMYLFDDLMRQYDRSITLSELQNKVRQLVAQYENDPRPVKMIVVDYLGLIRLDGKARISEYDLTTKVVNGLKDLTVDTKVPLVALCQLRRPEKGQESKPPTMNDLRSSGQIEADADKIILVHNPLPTGDTRPDEPRPALLRIGKYKDGAGGDVPAMFMGQFYQFVAAAEEQE